MIKLDSIIRIPFLPECVTVVTITKNSKDKYAVLTKVNTVHSQELYGCMNVYTSIKEYIVKYASPNDSAIYTQRNDDYVGYHRTVGTVDHKTVEFFMPKFSIPYHSTLIDTPDMVIRDDGSSRVIYSDHPISNVQRINDLYFPVIGEDEAITVRKESGNLITYSRDLSRVESEEFLPGINIEYFYMNQLFNNFISLIDYIKVPIKKLPNGEIQYDVYKFDYDFEDKQEV